MYIFCKLRQKIVCYGAFFSFSVSSQRSIKMVYAHKLWCSIPRVLYCYMYFGMELIMLASGKSIMSVGEQEMV